MGEFGEETAGEGTGVLGVMIAGIKLDSRELGADRCKIRRRLSYAIS